MLEFSQTGDFGIVGQTVWQVICYAGIKLPVSHSVHVFAHTMKAKTFLIILAIYKVNVPLLTFHSIVF